MSIDRIFNELSLAPMANDKYAAQSKMSGFVRTLNEANKQGIRGPLRIPINFFSVKVAPDYSLHDWTDDSDVTKEERMFIKTLATKSPFLIDSAWTEAMALEYDFKIDAHQVAGCGIAYLLDGLSVSILSEACWDTHVLNLTVEQLEGDDIQATSKEIVHASRPAHILKHLDWVINRLANSVDCGDDVWQRRGELFPSLTFCEAVEKQVRELDYGPSMLQQVVNSLFALEAFCKIWTEGAFESKRILLPMPTSPESSATLKYKKGKFEHERTFRCPDGIERVFSWHAKIGFNAWRIHFWFDDAKPSTLLIGYIGKHLPTVSDKT